MECLLHAGNHVRCSGYSGEQTAQNKKHPRLYDATILAGGVGEWPCYKPTAECVLEGVWQWGHRPTFVLTGPTRFFSPGHLQWGFRDAKFFTPFRRLEVQDEGAGRLVPSEAPLLGTCVATVLLPSQAVISPCTCIHGVCTFPFLYKDTSHFRLASYLNSLIYLFELQLPSLKIFFPSAVAFWDMGGMRHQHLNFGGRKFAHNTWLVFPSSCLWNTSHTIFFFNTNSSHF